MAGAQCTWKWKQGDQLERGGGEGGTSVGGLVSFTGMSIVCRDFVEVVRLVWRPEESLKEQVLGPDDAVHGLFGRVSDGADREALRRRPWLAFKALRFAFDMHRRLHGRITYVLGIPSPCCPPRDRRPVCVLWSIQDPSAWQTTASHVCFCGQCVRVVLRKCSGRPWEGKQCGLERGGRAWPL